MFFCIIKLQFIGSIQHLGKIFLEIKRLLPAHHQLNVCAGIIERIDKAFSELADMGMLKQEAGIFDFEDFQIHI